MEKASDSNMYIFELIRSWVLSQLVDIYMCLLSVFKILAHKYGTHAMTINSFTVGGEHTNFFICTTVSPVIPS